VSVIHLVSESLLMLFDM